MSKKHRELAQEMVDKGSVEEGAEVPSFFEKLARENAIILDAVEAAAFLRITLNALRVKVSRREIPHFKVGRRVFFSREMLEDWLKQHLVTTRSGGFPF